MPKTRPPYPEQFRREALEPVRQGGSIPDVAASLGVSEPSLRNRRRQTSATAASAMTPLTSEAREELRELRRRGRAPRAGA
jgi:transposase